MHMHSIMLLILLASTTLYAQTRLQDIRVLNEIEKAELAKRYKEYSSNPELFSEAQFQSIEAQKLGPVIAILILHPQIKLDEAQDVVEFAQTIIESSYSFAQLERRILKGVSEKETAFHALAEAIEKEDAHQWRKNQVAKVKEEKGLFLQAIEKLNLSKEETEKVIHVYGACMAFYKNKEDREFATPSICDPMQKYPAPRHEKHPGSVRTKKSGKETPQILAYRALAAEALNLANTYSLTDFEKIKMSKCVAEQAIRFFKYQDHLLRSVCKTIDLDTKSPEEAFFMHTGLCANFSGIAYNFALDLDMKGRVFIAKKGMHTYLEFESNHNWFHMHAFNNQTRCDITRF